MRVKIAKWGNSLGVRLPRQLADELGLKPGVEVEVAREGTKVAIETAPPRKIPRYRLEDLVAQMKPEDQPELIDWGPDVGAEIIDDEYSRGEITPEDALSKDDDSRSR